MLTTRAIKELQAENKKLKLSNAAYKNNSETQRKMISELKEERNLVKKQGDERLAKLNAIKETNTELKKDYNNLREENEILKKDNKALKDDYYAIHIDYKVDTAKLRENIESLQSQLKGASTTANEYAGKLNKSEEEPSLRISRNKTLNLVIEKQKAELAELKEKNAAQVGVIAAKEARLQELLAFNPDKKNKPFATQFFESICQLLNYNPVNTSQADIHNAIVDLKAKNESLIKSYNDLQFENTKLKGRSELTFGVSLRLRETLGIDQNSNTEQMVNRVKELVDAYNKAVKRGAEVFGILGIDKDSPDLIQQVKQMVVDNFNLKANNESYKSYFSNIQKQLGCQNSVRIHKAIDQLQADIEAARKQEDINARALSEIEKALKGIFTHREFESALGKIEKVIHDLRKPDVSFNVTDKFSSAMTEALNAMKDFKKVANLTGKTFRLPFQDLDDPKPFNFDKRYTAKEDIKAGSPVQFTDDGYIQYAGRGKRYDDAKKELLETLKRTLDQLALKEIDSVCVEFKRFKVLIIDFHPESKVGEAMNIIKNEIDLNGSLPDITINKKNGYSIGIININK